jgi:pyruvate dehydrogenase phosphatase
MLICCYGVPSELTDTIRDDLTVEVIFFGESESTGNVVINAEATAVSSNGELKAKL